MRAKAAVTCLAVLSGSPTAAQPGQSPSASQTVPELALSPAPPPATGLLAKLSDKVIREAVRDSLAEPVDNPRRHEADTLRGNSYTEFAQQFSEARVPDCLHGDALKRQPPRIGPIGFSYLAAVPFVVLAKLRGKCN